MAYKKLEALRNNINAIETAWQVINSKTGAANVDQRQVLMQYSGFGGIKDALCINELCSMHDGDTEEEIFRSYSVLDIDIQSELLRLREVIKAMYTDDDNSALLVAESISNSILTAFYTPQPVVDAIGDAIHHVFDTMGVKARTMLDPSCGIGRFLSIADNDMETVAFEKDIVTSMILRALHPGTMVCGKGFETIDTVRSNAPELIPDLFDIVASNIPFGDFKVYDKTFDMGDEPQKKAVQRIHNYFFLKGLEQLEDGGVLAFITSRGVADAPSNAYVRQWMVEHGDLLAVLRLPDNIFVEGSGVEVGCDLIVFQRNSNKSWWTTNEHMFVESMYDKPIFINGRVEHVESVNKLMSQASRAIFTHRTVETNRYGKRVITYQWRDGIDKLAHELRLRLMRDMERGFKHSSWQWGHDEERKKRERDAKQQQLDKLRKGREKHEAKISEMRPMYEKMMEAYNTLMTNERRDKVADPFGREDLNDAYDELVAKFGPLHKNESVIRNFDEPALALSLEKQVKRQWVKADVFDHPIAFRIFDEEERLTPLDALNMSINEFGRVKMRFMMDRTGMNEEQLYDELRGEIFYYPENAEDDNCGLIWYFKHQLLNGNVIKKRKVAEHYLAGGGLSSFDRGALLHSIQALTSVTPTAIPFEDIDLQLGQRWMPCKFYERFAQFIFKCGHFTIAYIKETDMYSFRIPFGDMGIGWTSGPWAAAGEYSGFKVLEFALQDKAPDCKKTKRDPETGEKVTVNDDDKRREVQAKMDEMRDAYFEFMHSDNITDEERKEIETIYNEAFNATIKANFDGSMQTFPGLCFDKFDFDDLYQSQKDAIMMLKCNRGGIIWHEVGGGKTMIMCVTAHEMKRIGLCNKPLIIGMNANAHQIYDTYIKAYPNDRVLFPGKDFNEKNLPKVFSQIAHNDWDCIILTHPQFKRLPQSLELQQEIIQNEVRELDEAMRVARHSSDITREAWRGLEKRRANMDKELKTIIQKINDRTVDSVDFHKMGIDYIEVDESQEFKNLEFSTRHGRVAGIGKTDGNQMTLSLLTAIRDIQKQKKSDLCAAFFSGTIVVNALTELYCVYKYLRPKSLEEQGIYCFDSWASLFIKKSSDYDLTPTGDVKQKERFRYYLNVPELSAQLREITDYRSADMINLDRPKANIIEDFTDPIPEQEMMLERLKLYAANGKWSVLDLHEKENHYGEKGLQFATTNLARDISMDVRMLGANQFHDHERNKASRCAERIAYYYRKFDAHKGTQFVFCDVSVEHHDGRFSIYTDVKKKLVNMYGIPEHEIKFIQDCNTPDKRKKVFDDMNNGIVRVLFGATKSLGTGVNAQKRAVAAHHLDIPWRPADLEQRNGRIVRKGNDVKIWGGNEVDIIIYGTNRTLDAYKFKLLQNKNLFTSQLCQGTVASRNYDDGAMAGEDENTGGIPYAEFVALLSGNTDLLTKAKLDAKIAQLEKQRKTHNNEVRSAKTKIVSTQTEINGMKAAIEMQKKDLEYAETWLSQHDGSACIEVFDAVEQTVEEQGRKLFDLRGEIHLAPGINVGTCYGGLVIHMQSTMMRDFSDPNGQKETLRCNSFDIQCRSGIFYKCNEFGTLGNSHQGAVEQFNKLPDAIKMRIAQNEGGIIYREKDIVALTATANKVWPYEEELSNLKTQAAELAKRIDADLKKKDAEKLKQANEAANE